MTWDFRQISSEVYWEEKLGFLLNVWQFHWFVIFHLTFHSAFISGYHIAYIFLGAWRLVVYYIWHTLAQQNVFWYLIQVITWMKTAHIFISVCTVVALSLNSQSSKVYNWTNQTTKLPLSQILRRLSKWLIFLISMLKKKGICTAEQVLLYVIYLWSHVYIYGQFWFSILSSTITVKG